jgi:hypothetical protein
MGGFWFFEMLEAIVRIKGEKEVVLVADRVLTSHY